MKPTSILFCIVILCVGLINSCKKDTAPKNITLHDQPLSVIQEYIQGNWKLQNTKGGFCGTCIFYPTDSTYNFYLNLNTLRIKFRNAHFKTLDTTINWLYVPDIVLGDSTYTLNFSDSSGIPFTFAANRIYNDTLVLYQPNPDGQSFYYIKSN